MMSKQERLTVALALAGIGLSWYWNNRNSATLRSLLRPSTGPASRPTQILPGVPTDTLGDAWIDTTLAPVDPLNRPGVYVDPATGDVIQADTLGDAYFGL